MKPISLLVLLLMLSISITSCEKETIEEEVPKNDLNLVGTWASTTVFTAQLFYKTTYRYNADGSGRHVILSVSPSEARTITDQTFKWSTKNNQRVLMEFQSGNNGEHGYEINGNTLVYTSEDNRKSTYLKEPGQ